MEGSNKWYDGDISQIRPFNSSSECASQWDPCIFPASSGAGLENSGIHAVKLLLQDVEFLTASWEGTLVDLKTIIQPAWGLLLRCYTGNDQVSFGYGECLRDILGNPADSFVMSIRHVEFMEDQRIHTIAEGSR